MVFGCTPKLTTSVTRQCFNILLCCTTKRHIYLTSLCSRIFNVPNDAEAIQLKIVYPEPKTLLNDLLQPLIEGDPSKAPVLHFNEEYKGRVWNANLQIQWPNKFSVNGVHKNIDQAEENAYLLACQLFFKSGLMQMKNGKAIPLCEKEVMSVIEDLTTSWNECSGSATNFRIVTTQSLMDGEKAWRSEIKLTWPFMMSAQGESTLLKSAQYEACLKSFIKLKSRKVLDRDNNLIVSEVLKFHTEPIARETKATIKPDFEIYVDASKHGYGAYLLNKEDYHVRWISEPWPQRVNKFSKIPLADMCSGFCELYALVAACYTWKHKFCDKSVLCWTDNNQIVEIINKGLYFCQQSKRNTKYAKLYVILRDTCQKYNIKLNVCHVSRVHNMAADHLSKFRIDEFREIVPTAISKSKKAKKLLFWEPLIDMKSPPPVEDGDLEKK